MVDFSSKAYGGVPRLEPRGGPRWGPKIFFFFAKYSQTPIYGIRVEKKVTPRVVFLKGPPLGPPLEFFSVSGWVGAPPWVSLMWGPLEGPPLGPPLEIFSVSGWVGATLGPNRNFGAKIGYF